MHGSRERFGGGDTAVDCVIATPADKNVCQQNDRMPCNIAAENVQIGQNNQLFVFSALNTSWESEGTDPSPVTSDTSVDSPTTNGKIDTPVLSTEFHQHGVSNQVNIVLPDQRYSLSEVTELIRKLTLVQQSGGAATENIVRVRIELTVNTEPMDSECVFDTTHTSSEDVFLASTHISFTGANVAPSTQFNSNVEEAAISVMRRSERLWNFFRRLKMRITNIFRGSIVLELTAESPESLKNLLESLEEFDSVLVKEFKDESILDKIKGNVLQAKISIIIPEGMVKASGITDLQQFVAGLHSKAGAIASDKPSILRAEKEINVAGGMDVGMDKFEMESHNSESKTGMERRILLFGTKGSGKSATGNNILNETFFQSGASKARRGAVSRNGRIIQIIDSPGLFDTEMTIEEITREIIRCVGMTAPGPHAFVLVVRIDRFTEEEQKTVAYFKRIFGDGMLNYLIILFTRKDDLQHDNKTLEMYLRDVPQTLKDLVRSCNNRCIAFNNRAPDVDDFLTMVDRVLMENCGRCYTNEMYEEAEKILKKQEEKIRQKKEKKKEMEKQFQLKFQQQHDEQLAVRMQLEKRLQALEQEKLNAGKEGERAMKDMSEEVEKLMLTLRENAKATEQLLADYLKMQRNAVAEVNDFRETFRQEIHKESGNSFTDMMFSTLLSMTDSLVISILSVGISIAEKVISNLIFKK